MGAIMKIVAERVRQIDSEGWTPEHDDTHSHEELALAAAAYCIAEEERRTVSGGLHRAIWPWDEEYWKPSPDDRIKELAKAGALIVAEIERLERLAPSKTG